MFLTYIYLSLNFRRIAEQADNMDNGRIKVITTAVSTNVFTHQFFSLKVELFHGLWTIIYNFFKKRENNRVIGVE